MKDVLEQRLQQLVVRKHVFFCCGLWGSERALRRRTPPFNPKTVNPKTFQSFVSLAKSYDADYLKPTT